jgi:hypothetical protein
MALKDMFNSVSNKVGSVGKSLSDLFSSTQTYANASSAFTPVPIKYSLKDRGVDITDDDLKALRPIIYGEVSNRTPDKQTLEANVITNTALNRLREYNARGQKKNLADVLSMPNQYQAYGGQQYNMYANPTDEVALAKKKQIDAIMDMITQQIKSGQYADNTEGSYYYVHEPDGRIRYDNKKKLFAD